MMNLSDIRIVLSLQERLAMVRQQMGLMERKDHDPLVVRLGGNSVPINAAHKAAIRALVDSALRCERDGIVSELNALGVSVGEPNG